VTYIAPLEQPDVLEVDPPATQSVVDEHATVVREPFPTWRTDHCRPELVVINVVVPPTAMHSATAGHETAASEPVPAGKGTCVQDVPPSPDRTINPVLDWDWPAAKQTLSDAHDTPLNPADTPEYVLVTSHAFWTPVEELDVEEPVAGGKVSDDCWLEARTPCSELPLLEEFDPRLLTSTTIRMSATTPPPTATRTRRGGILTSWYA
jgi:hypothetical protein